VSGLSDSQRGDTFRSGSDPISDISDIYRHGPRESDARRANHPKVCPARREKIFRLTRRANQRHYFARLTADEGRIMIVTNARWDAVDAKGARDESA